MTTRPRHSRIAPLRICLAIDGSAASSRAVGAAIRLAAAAGLRPEFAVVSVDEPLPLAAAASMGTDATMRYHADNHRYYTRNAKSKLHRAGYAPTLHFYVDAEPAAALARHLRRHPADLLVAGSRGRSALAAAVLGSVVTKLLSHTKVPLLVVR